MTNLEHMFQDAKHTLAMGLVSSPSAVNFSWVLHVHVCMTLLHDKYNSFLPANVTFDRNMSPFNLLWTLFFTIKYHDTDFQIMSFYSYYQRK